MLNILNRLFGRKNAPTQVNSPKSPPSLEDLLRADISASIYVKPEFRGVVFTAIIDGSKLKTGRCLTAEEKRSAGLNSRLQIYQAQVDALTVDGLLYGPEKLFTALYMGARHKAGRAKSIESLAEAGFPFFALLSCKDERECTWCKANNGRKFPAHVDINQLISKNCSCEYCRCTIIVKRK